MASQQGVAHVMLSVTDAEASAEWYRMVFDGTPAFSGNDEHGPIEVVVAGGLMLGFRTHRKTRGAFDETRTGLDHLGIGTTGEDIEKWRARLDELGIKHSGIIEDPFGKHLNFRDPDNIALEMYAPPA